MFSLPISYNDNTLDDLVLLLVIAAYQASAKNTNNGNSFRYSGCFNFEEEGQRAQKNVLEKQRVMNMVVVVIDESLADK